jgi:hypothetical protein
MDSIFNQMKELQQRASELKNCFYCKGALPASQQEHIFNAAWGGSHKTGQLICDACNQSFSRNVDEAFSLYTTAIMNAWSFKGQRHKSVPIIELDGDYVLEAGAKLRIKPEKPLFEEKNLPNGQIRTKISFNSKGEAKRWLNNGAAESWLGRSLTPEEREYLLRLIQESEPQRREPEPQPASTTLDLRNQYRSSAHTILKCLGFFLPDWVCSPLTQPIRQFARYDEGDWRLFAVEPEQFFSLGEEITNLLGLGVYHNSVEIYWSSSLRMIVGILTLLNRVKRAVIISDKYTGSDKILYVFEDTNNSKKPPRAILAEIDSEQFCQQLLNIQYFASPTKMYEYFQNDLVGLTTIYYPIDAITNSFRKSFEEVNKHHTTIEDSTIEQYQTLFLEFFIKLGKISQVPVDSVKIDSKLQEYGFSILRLKFKGRNITDPEVESMIVQAFNSVLSDLKENRL